MSTTIECCVNRRKNNALLATDFYISPFHWYHHHHHDESDFSFFLLALLVENIVKMTLKHLFFCVSQSKRHWKGKFTSLNYDSDPDSLRELIFASLSIIFVHKILIYMFCWSNFSFDIFHLNLHSRTLFWMNFRLEIKQLNFCFQHFKTFFFIKNFQRV